MNTEQILTDLSNQSDSLRALALNATQELRLLQQRLEQIVQQLRKNIAIRDQAFATDFNTFCLNLRHQLDAWEPAWTQTRALVRTVKPGQWNAELALTAKGFNSQARMLSRANDEFTTVYSNFVQIYKSFTAAKLHVFLLTSCQTDMENLTSKILFLAREIATYTSRNRGTYARG